MQTIWCFCSLRFTTPSRGAWCMFPLYVTVFLFLLSIICRSLRLRSNNNKFILINNMQQRQAALWRSQGRRNGFGMWVRVRSKTFDSFLVDLDLVALVCVMFLPLLFFARSAQFRRHPARRRRRTRQNHPTFCDIFHPILQRLQGAGRQGGNRGGSTRKVFGAI